MPGESRDKPIDRPSARVILLDAHDRILLFTVGEPDEETGRPFWFPPGGALEPGETYEQAARRELSEETGIESDPGPCVWTRTHTWYFRAHDAWYRSIERYFFVRVEQPDIVADRWTDLEVRVITSYRWWSLDEIATAAVVFVPRRLASILPPIIAGRRPSAPFDVGA